MENRMIGEYIIKEQVGEGSYTAVWKARHATKGIHVAIKQVNLGKINRRLRECLDCELSFLGSVSHPNIIRLHHTFQDNDSLFIVLEYCSGGDLATYIRRYGRVQEQVAKQFMQQLGAGLEVLHAHHVIHRDLKPQNLLLSTNDSSALLKISDLGLSRCLLPDKKTEMVCGTPFYMAPEVLGFEKYDLKADLWSVGAILFELLNGHPPFMGRSNYQVLQKIKSCIALPFCEMILSDLHSDCIDVCNKLLCQNPEKRLSAKEFLKHEFLSS